MQSHQPNKDAVSQLLQAMKSDFAIYLESPNIKNFITEKDLKNSIEYKKLESIQVNMATLIDAFQQNEYFLDAEYLIALKELYMYLLVLVKKDEEEISKEKATYTQVEKVYTALQQTHAHFNDYRNKYHTNAKNLLEASDNLLQASTILYEILAKRDKLQKAGDVLGTACAAILGFIVGAILGATVIVPIVMLICNIYDRTFSCGNILVVLFAPITFPFGMGYKWGKGAHDTIAKNQMYKNTYNCSTLFQPALAVSDSYQSLHNDPFGKKHEKFAKIPGIKV